MLQADVAAHVAGAALTHDHSLDRVGAPERSAAIRAKCFDDGQTDSSKYIEVQVRGAEVRQLERRGADSSQIVANKGPTP